MTKYNKCLCCRWATPTSHDFQFSDGKEFICRRHAPTREDVVVRGDDFCGDYEMSDEFEKYITNNIEGFQTEREKRIRLVKIIIYELYEKHEHEESNFLCFTNELYHELEKYYRDENDCNVFLGEGGESFLDFVKRVGERVESEINEMKKIEAGINERKK